MQLNEERWVDLVRHSLERESAEVLGAGPKVFDVPRAMRDTKPEAYTPQHFALGPYHQARPELRDMERFKLAAAKRVEKFFKRDRRIGDLVKHFLDGRLDYDVRATYHRYLELKEDTLAWMMALDVCFVLDFLQGYRRDDTADMLSLSSSPANWVSAVARDVMMLENQVPLFLFAETLELCVSTEQVAVRTVRNVFERFVKDVCPIKISANRFISDFAEKKHAHLLELLYRFLVPDAAAFGNEDSSAGAGGQQNNPGGITEEELDADDVEKQPQFQDYDKVKKACIHVCSLDVAPLRSVKEKLISRPMSAVTTLSEKITRKVPVLSVMVPMLGKLIANKVAKERLEGMDLGSIASTSPLAQEIKVPSVTQLAECGVRFAPAPEGVAGISFNRATATLSLPVITLDGNTEVVLRNLVAYEAVAVHGPLVLARYTELMNGIIDTGKDVKVLKDSGVVVNRMKSNKDAAAMWNGMCRATRISKVPRLDGVIQAVNDHRNRTAKVRVVKLLKNYVFGSWKVLTLLASIVLLVMTALQTFCSAYPCPSIWFGALLPPPGDNSTLIQ